MFFKAKIKCAQNLNFHQYYFQFFIFNLQQDLKIAAFWENPEKNWSTFSKIQQISAKFWQNLQHFVKND